MLSFYRSNSAGSAPSDKIKANYESIISKAKSPAGQTGGVVVLTHEINGYTMAMAQQGTVFLLPACPHAKSLFKRTESC